MSRVHRRMLCTPQRYHDSHGGILIHGRGYYECIGGCSAHPGFQYKLNDFYPPSVLNISLCTEQTYTE